MSCQEYLALKYSRAKRVRLKIPLPWRDCRDAGLGYGYKLNQRYVKKWESELSGGPMIHDFRRTAVRNLDRAGVPQAVAMKMTGQKTPSIYRRYDIVDKKDLKRAAEQQENYLNGKTTAKTATN